jgi:hypothetical protein
MQVHVVHELGPVDIAIFCGGQYIIAGVIVQVSVRPQLENEIGSIN